MSRDDIERLLKKISEDPDSKLFVALAEEYKKAGLIDEAISTLVQGLEKQPHYLSARVSLGNIYMGQGRLTDAKTEFERVIASIPDNLYFHKNLAEIYRELGQTEKAINELNIVLNLNPTDEWAIVSLAAVQRESPEAGRTEERAEATEPEPVPGESVAEEPEAEGVQSGVPGGGEEMWADQPTGDGGLPTADVTEGVNPAYESLLRAEESIRNGNYSEAMDAYKAILVDDPDNREVLQRVAELKALFKMLGKDQDAHILKLESFLEKIRQKRDEFFSTR